VHIDDNGDESVTQGEQSYDTQTGDYILRTSSDAATLMHLSPSSACADASTLVSTQVPNMFTRVDAESLNGLTSLLASGGGLTTSQQICDLFLPCVPCEATLTCAGSCANSCVNGPLNVDFYLFHPVYALYGGLYGNEYRNSLLAMMLGSYAAAHMAATMRSAAASQMGVVESFSLLSTATSALGSRADLTSTHLMDTALSGVPLVAGAAASLAQAASDVASVKSGLGI
jgi:hypothetical protein